MRKKELHIWMDEDVFEKLGENKLCVTFDITEKALENSDNRVDTVQPHFCSTTWLVKGYRIFVHMLDEKMVEIKLGFMKDVGNVRVSQNLEKMLLSNIFGYATRDYMKTK